MIELSIYSKIVYLNNYLFQTFSHFFWTLNILIIRNHLGLHKSHSRAFLVAVKDCFQWYFIIFKIMTKVTALPAPMLSLEVKNMMVMKMEMKMEMIMEMIMMIMMEMMAEMIMINQLRSICGACSWYWLPHPWRTYLFLQAGVSFLNLIYTFGSHFVWKRGLYKLFKQSNIWQHNMINSEHPKPGPLLGHLHVMHVQPSVWGVHNRNGEDHHVRDSLTIDMIDMM